MVFLLRLQIELEAVVDVVVEGDKRRICTVACHARAHGLVNGRFRPCDYARFIFNACALVQFIELTLMSLGMPYKRSSAEGKRRALPATKLQTLS